MNAGMLMDTTIVTLRRDAVLSEIYAVMSQYRQTDFPVVDANNQLVGMLYEEDILKALTDAVQSKDGTPLEFNAAASRMLHLLPIRTEEIMTPDIGWVTVETELSKLALTMREKKVRSLPVMSNSQVVGLVSERAIFMALLKQGVAVKASLDVKPQPQSQLVPPQERRKHPRKTADFKLAYKPVSIKMTYRLTDESGSSSQHRARIAKCINLSLGGLLARSPEEFSIDDVLDIAFEIPHSRTAIRRLARVTRAVPAPEAGQYHLGLFFLALSIQESTALSAYLMTLPG